MSDQSSHQVPPVPEAQAGNSPTTKVSRNYVACRRCHAQKIKCNGEAPCRNCKVSKSPVDCIYPMRDRKITVSERLAHIHCQNSCRFEWKINYYDGT